MDPTPTAGALRRASATPTPGRAARATTRCELAPTTTRGPGRRPRPRSDVPVDVSAAHVTAVLVAFDAARWLPTPWPRLADLRHRPAPADRHRQRQHRRHPDPAGPGPSTRACSTRSTTGKRHASGSAPRSKSALRQDRDAPQAERHDAAQRGVRPTSTTGSGCCTTTPCPPPTRCTGCWPRHPRPHASTSPAPSCCCPSVATAASRISEVGVSISGTGRRELQLDTGEIDQGQRDQPQAAARRLHLRDAGPDRGLAATSTASTRRCRSSATGSSSAGGPI